MRPTYATKCKHDQQIRMSCSQVNACADYTACQPQANCLLPSKQSSSNLQLQQQSPTMQLVVFVIMDPTGDSSGIVEPTMLNPPASAATGFSAEQEKFIRDLISSTSSATTPASSSSDPPPPPPPPGSTGESHVGSHTIIIPWA